MAKPSIYAEMTIIQDTREQDPWRFEGFEGQVKRATLKSGDYSVWGFHRELTIERKSLSDYLASITHGRDRFEREVTRLACFRRACVIIEGDRSVIAAENYRSMVVPAAALSTADSWWLKYGVPFFFEPSRQLAEDRALRIMKLWFKRFYKAGYEFCI